MPEEKSDKMLKILNVLENNVDKIQNQIGEIQDKIDGMQDQIGEIQDKIDGMQDQIGGIQDKIDGMQDQIGGIQDKIDGMQNQMNQFEERIDKKIYEAQRNQNRKLAYFEHVYGGKITAIFDKLQLIDDMRNLDKEDQEKFKNQIELNSAEIMMHDSRISKLENVFNSK